MREAHRNDLIRTQVRQVAEEARGRWSDVEQREAFLYFSAREAVSRHTYRFRFDLEQYDLYPAKLDVVHQSTLRPRYRRELWPHRSGVAHKTLHPDTGRPWCCIQGLYEYHTHYHHLHDPWDKHRNNYTLFRVVQQIVAKLEGDTSGGPQPITNLTPPQRSQPLQIPQDHPSLRRP